MAEAPTGNAKKSPASLDIDDRADIDAGAPTNADGTINLVHYAAWLVKEMSEAGGD
jgi:hypothetical protein